MVPGEGADRGVRPVRVARVITRLNVGGPAIQALLLSERLDPSRYETLLICGNPGPHEGDMRDFRRLSAVRPVVIKTLGRSVSPLDDLITLWMIVRELRRFRPDIVHTHLAKAGLVGRVAARLVGVPIVLHTFHGNVLRGYFGESTSRLLRMIERLLAHLTTRIIVISPQQAAEIAAVGIPSSKLVEVPLGLDLGPFLSPAQGALRAELGIDVDVPLVGIVARLVPIKAVDVFLEAAALVSAGCPGARFVVVGDGELRDSLRALSTALGIDPVTTFLGWRSDLPAIYADLDILALTSKNEGTPVSVIEALAAGRAVVATAVGGVPDLLGRGAGVLVAPGDPGALADAILGLLRDSEARTRQGAIGRGQVFPEHDAALLVRRIEDLYSSLLSAWTDRG